MKIIRNIDGKKLELTLTNEEAMIQATSRRFNGGMSKGKACLPCGAGRLRRGRT